MMTPDALRLVAAQVHTIPSISVVLGPDHGTEVVVGSDRRCLPDLSPCELRRLVAEQRRGDGPELSWLASVERLELGGPEVSDVIEDVVRVGGRDEPVLTFATLLGPLATPGRPPRRGSRRPGGGVGRPGRPRRGAGQHVPRRAPGRDHRGGGREPAPGLHLAVGGGPGLGPRLPGRRAPPVGGAHRLRRGPTAVDGQPVKRAAVRSGVAGRAGAVAGPAGGGPAGSGRSTVRAAPGEWSGSWGRSALWGRSGWWGRSGRGVGRVGSGTGGRRSRGRRCR